MKTRLPKLHLICSDDSFRPIFNHVLVTKDEICATDAHKLVLHKTDEMFPSEFIHNMPERFLIHREHWKILSKPFEIIKIEGDYITVYPKLYDLNINHTIKISYESDSMKFPDYKAIFPTGLPVELSAIGLNASKLKDVQDGLIFPDQVNALKLEFYGEHKAILITATDSDNNGKAILMPVALDM